MNSRFLFAKVEVVVLEVRLESWFFESVEEEDLQWIQCSSLQKEVVLDELVRLAIQLTLQALKIFEEEVLGFADQKRGILKVAPQFEAVAVVELEH